MVSVWLKVSSCRIVYVRLVTMTGCEKLLQEEMSETTSCPNSPHTISTTAIQHFAGMNLNSAADPCCWLMVQPCGWGNCCQRTQILRGGPVVCYYHHPVSDRNSMFSCTLSVLVVYLQGSCLPFKGYRG